MNGKPHYSADSGFACAASGRGITEALQEHLNIIVRDENLEIAFDHEHYQTEIDALVEDRGKLEQQKAQRQNTISQAIEELEKKSIELAELKVKLESPVELLETSEGSRIVELNEKIEDNISEIDSKKEEKAKLETDLESPTQVELDTLNTDGAIPQQSGNWFSKLRHRVPKLIFASFATAAIIALFFYLYLFYVSAGEKIVKSSDDMDLTALIDYKALDRSWQSSDDDPRRWLILMFPSIFIFLVIVTHLAWYSEKWTKQWKKWAAVIFFIFMTFLVEAVVGLDIAEKIVNARKDLSESDTDDVNWDAFWESGKARLFFLFLILGFGPSVLLGFGLHWVLGLWENIRPIPDQSKQMEIQIRAEKNDKLVELSALNTEIQNLEEGLIRLDEEKRTYSETLVKTYQHPIETQIAGLDAEIQSIQDEIQLFNEQVDSLQMEIDRCESEISNHLKGQRNRVIDINKMEAQVHEFVTGWCRYVAQCRTDLQPQEISSQIIEIQELAKQTLEDFKTIPITV